MTNKLKVTSALVGSLLALSATSAVAQTTVSGNLALSYISAKSENKAQSFRGFGKESQINIANKGKLASRISVLTKSLSFIENLKSFQNFKSFFNRNRK
jgi:O-glycosyl hydrolase